MSSVWGLTTPPVACGSPRQSPKDAGTRSASLNGPRSSESFFVGTMAWPPTATVAISTAAIAARRFTRRSDILELRSRARGDPAQPAVGGDDEDQRRHEQHQPRETV